MKITAISPNAISPREGAPRVHLTPRQLEVLALLCEGLPNKLISRHLNISAGTVKVHISCILRELGVSSRLQAVVSARQLGLDAASRVKPQEERVYSRAPGQRGPELVSASPAGGWAAAA